MHLADALNQHCFCKTLNPQRLFDNRCSARQCGRCPAQHSVGARANGLLRSHGHVTERLPRPRHTGTSLRRWRGRGVAQPACACAARRQTAPGHTGQCCRAAGVGRVRCGSGDAASQRTCLRSGHTGNAASLWERRRQLFFKPLTGFGGRAVYRGDKLTRRVWDDILAGQYIAQSLVAPGYRAVAVDNTPTELKFDIRAYTYARQLQLLAARTYQGQTTNFRTEGSGFAPVMLVPPLTSGPCCTGPAQA
jgi:hypothetical protein